MNLHEKIAVFFVAMSWLIFAGVLLLPFISLEHDKLIVAAIIYFISQMVFWTGCAIGGKEIVRRFQVDKIVSRWWRR